MRVWVDTLLRGGEVHRRVLLEADETGTVVAEHTGSDRPTDALALGVASAGFANGHSHAFHRVLRGRTHVSGSFWTWRELMYRAAGRLTPDRYRDLATLVFAEMVTAGWTSVGEFHYVHHRPDGTAYPAHAMELALVDAAETAGIRLVLLDTCYLAGGIGQPLGPEQRRFADAGVHAWLDRWHDLQALIAQRSPRVTLGAALHSVRAVPREALSVVNDALPGTVPLHIHLSEQTAENEDSLAHYGLTPTGLLEAEGVLSPRLSVVHATHLSPADIAALGRAGATAVFCPTTEADLGDGIGPARELADAGVVLAVGSDQNAIVDPWLELRGLEAGERLRSRTRGRIDPVELWRIGSDGGHRALGLPEPARVGGPLDLVEVDPRSVRTAGSAAMQMPLSATASDVRRVVVGGAQVAHDPVELGAALDRSITELFEEDV
ncbi:formimidoylglutamate deiminase [Microbacterium enclense]|uniref:formimidoylglutamate deiminase n=1 Tax=Microbacterium enclense TaxID=993073 RepID=UPI0021A6F4F8|nr:formimidoylglutamate deiminase [Microbacterium enclense]MCT2085150.1 formimidoylglutamate deiminase [Microbacterium enclense]